MTKTTRARIAASVRAYWKTVHSVQRKTGLTVPAARVVARTLRAKGYTTARTLKPGQAARIVRTERQKTYRLTRQKDVRTLGRELATEYARAESAAERAAIMDEAIDAGATITVQDETPTVLQTLDDWIDAYDGLEDDDLEPPEDYDVTPDYKRKA